MKKVKETRKPYPTELTDTQWEDHELQHVGSLCTVHYGTILIIGYFSEFSAVCKLPNKVGAETVNPHECR